MRLVAPRADLRRATAALKHGDDRGPATVEVEPQALHRAVLTAGTSDSGVRIALDLADPGDPGQATVALRALAQAVRGQGEAVIRSDPRALYVDEAAIDLAPDGLPAPPEPGAALGTIDADDLARMLRTVAHAGSRSSAHPHLCGVFVELDEAGSLTLTATDGHRLATTSARVPTLRAAAPFGLLVPPRPIVDALLALVDRKRPAADRAELWLSDELLSVRIGSVWLWARGARDTFPDYRRVLPDPAPTRCLSLERQHLLDAIDHVLAADRSRHVECTLGFGASGLRLARTDAPDLAATAAGWCGPSVRGLTCGIDLIYLRQAVDAMPWPHLAIREPDTPLSQLRIDPDGASAPSATAVVMPRRL